MAKRGRPRKGAKSGTTRRDPSPDDIEALRAEIEASGETIGADFKQWLKKHAERELWFFSRWILGNTFLSMGDFHRKQVCPWLTDYSHSRSKLMMLPFGHLKTTVVSRSMPLHALVQPRDHNIYFPGMPGREARILLGNENEDKCKENMDVLKRHAQQNQWLYWLWPDVFWDDPKKESPRWSDSQLEFQRSGIYAEPSISIVGVKTGYIGKYYDMILPDDICGPKDAQSPKDMDKIKKWRRASKTRFYIKSGPCAGIYCGIGTHHGSEDVYTEWKKDPGLDLMIRSIEEPDSYGVLKPIWPEKYPADLVEKMRASTDQIEWALWYMNKPVPAGYTALNWSDLREYALVWREGVPLLAFAENKDLDSRAIHRYEVKSKNLGFRLRGSTPYDPMNARPRNKPVAGQDRDMFDALREKYPECPHCLEEGNHIRTINSSLPFRCPVGHEWTSPAVAIEPEYKFLGNRFAQSRS
jgi:hypothetical protein